MVIPLLGVKTRFADKSTAEHYEHTYIHSSLFRFGAQDSVVDNVPSCHLCGTGSNPVKACVKVVVAHPRSVVSLGFSSFLENTGVQLVFFFYSGFQ